MFTTRQVPKSDLGFKSVGNSRLRQKTHGCGHEMSVRNVRHRREQVENVRLVCTHRLPDQKGPPSPLSNVGAVHQKLGDGYVTRCACGHQKIVFVIARGRAPQIDVRCSAQVSHDSKAALLNGRVNGCPPPKHIVDDGSYLRDALNEWHVQRKTRTMQCPLAFVRVGINVAGKIEQAIGHVPLEVLCGCVQQIQITHQAQMHAIHAQKSIHYVPMPILVRTLDRLCPRVLKVAMVGHAQEQLDNLGASTCTCRQQRHVHASTTTHGCELHLRTRWLLKSPFDHVRWIVIARKHAPVRINTEHLQEALHRNHRSLLTGLIEHGVCGA